MLYFFYKKITISDKTEISYQTNKTNMKSCQSASSNTGMRKIAESDSAEVCIEVSEQHPHSAAGP